MKNKLLLKKISSVSFDTLLKIFWFKFQYRLFILVEKVKLKILPLKKYYNYKGKINLNIQIKELYEVYYNFTTNNNDVVNKADEILKKKIVLFGKSYTIKESDWLKDPISKKEWNRDVFFADSKVTEATYGDVKFVMELNKMGFLVSLAHAYYLNSDERNIRKIKDYLTGWTNTVNYEKSVVHKSMLDVSFRCLNLVQISLLCFNNSFFKSNVFPLIIGILVASEKQIRKFSTPRWTKFSTGLNHTIGEMVGLIITQLFLEKFTNKSYKQYYKKQFYYLNRSLENIITSKGVYLEQSSHYAKLVAEFLVMLDITVNTLRNDEQVSCYNQNHLIKLLQYINIIAYNDVLPNFGDNDGAKVLYPFYSENYSISHLLKYLKYIYTDKSDDKVLICKESGQFVWKSKDSNKVYIFTRSGKHSFLPIGSGSHAHNDILSLVISVHNKPLFIDYGTYFYNSGIEILNKDRSTANHNTITISNIEQASLAGKWMYGSYPQARILENEILANDTLLQFKGICEYSGKTHIRSVKYISSELIIFDQIKCDKKDKIAINFLLDPNIDVIKDSETNIYLYNGKNKIALMQFADSINVEIQTTVYHPSYGIERQTQKIIGFSNVRGNQDIATLIRIL